jgi:hypothetical protein
MSRSGTFAIDLPNTFHQMEFFPILYRQTEFEID